MKSKEEKIKEAELNRKKEQLSVAFLHAVLAKVGGGVQQSTHLFDDMGVDAVCGAKNVVVGGIKMGNSLFYVQLKATSNAVDHGSYYSVPLKKKQYLRYRRMCCEDGIPLTLCVLILPDDLVEDLLVEVTTEELIMRGKMYWLEFDCASTKQTLKLPKTNKVNEDGIKKLMLRCREKNLRSIQ